MRTLHKTLRWCAWDFVVPWFNLSSFGICFNVEE